MPLMAHLLTLVFACTIWRVYPSAEGAPILVIGGNFTLNGQRVNLAQYDISTGSWSNHYQPELYLYGESYGVVWDMVVNYTTPYDQLYVVGSFDTISATSQAQYCSVGMWSGTKFSKVGEGLCPRSDITSKMKIITTIVGNDGDLFVGGMFEARVWDGKKFTNIFNLAHFKASDQTWLPLAKDQLGCSWCDATVNSLAWDPVHGTLYIAGMFDMVSDTWIPSGLATWNHTHGLQPFQGGGLSMQNPNNDGVGVSIAWEPKSRSLVVGGFFTHVNNTPCTCLAVYSVPLSEWFCLYEQRHAISYVTTLTLDNEWLYVGGWGGSESSWGGQAWQSPYTIVRCNFSEFIDQVLQIIYPPPPTPPTVHNPTHAPTHAPVHMPNPIISPTEMQTTHNLTNYDRLSSRRPRMYIREQFHINMSHTRLNVNPNLNTSLLRRYKRRHRYLRATYTQQRARETDVVKLPWWVEAADSAFSRSRMLHIRWITRRRIIDDSSDQPSKANMTAREVLAAWVPPWEFLPGFSGGNGPILRITPGKGSYDKALFIAGAFNNYPPVVVWASSPVGYTVNGIAVDGELSGLVTSVAQMIGPVTDTPPSPTPSRIIEVAKDYTWLILIACMLGGVFIGMLLAVSCHSRSYARIPNSAAAGIPLKTLTLSLGDLDMNFRESFERAMKARHLPPSQETLMVVNPDEIVLQKIIGEGSFGRVWSASWRSTHVAVKEFVFAQAAISGGSMHRTSIIEEIVGEAGIMACLRHPKILQLYGCSLTVQAIWIVSELCSRGSLRMLLTDKNEPLPTHVRIGIALDISDAMLYLHTRDPPIIHRDLKSHNIFMHEHSKGVFIAKLGDWGSARAVALSGPHNTMTHGIGTACWLAPEVIEFDQSSKASDVYAFGIVLWEIATREEVHEGLTAAQIIIKVAHEELRPKIPRDCPWREIMRDCWHQASSRRPSFQRVTDVLTSLHCEYGPQTVDSDTMLVRTHVHAHPDPRP